MSNELQQYPDQNEVVSSQKEVPIPVPDRIVIFGRLGGSFFERNDLPRYLSERGFKNFQFTIEKDCAFLKEGFFGNYIQNDGSTAPINIPRGVILMPVMRQYTPTNIGMSFPTFETDIPERIEKMCEEHGVPLIRVYNITTDEQIKAGLSQFTPQSP